MAKIVAKLNFLIFGFENLNFLNFRANFGLKMLNFKANLRFKIVKFVARLNFFLKNVDFITQNCHFELSQESEKSLFLRYFATLNMTKFNTFFINLRLKMLNFRGF